MVSVDVVGAKTCCEDGMAGCDGGRVAGKALFVVAKDQGCWNASRTWKESGRWRSMMGAVVEDEAERVVVAVSCCRSQ
jgi:hypothetical protein